MTTQDANPQDTTNALPEPGPMSREWHWHPYLPVKYAPYWNWPPKIGVLAKWVWHNWLQFSDRSIFLALAFLVAFWVQPVGVGQASFAPGWVSWVFIRNWVLLLIVAGGLHMWFYGVDGQGKLLKYDPRPYMKRKNALYKFGYQTWDNTYYSMVFGATFLSMLECFLRWMYANNYIATLSFTAHPVWFVLLFPILAIWQSFHFYVVHLLLHQPFIYRHVHAVHHRNVNIGPWSGHFDAPRRGLREFPLFHNILHPPDTCRQHPAASCCFMGYLAYAGCSLDSIPFRVRGQLRCRGYGCRRC